MKNFSSIGNTPSKTRTKGGSVNIPLISVKTRTKGGGRKDKTRTKGGGRKKVLVL